MSEEILHGFTCEFVHEGDTCKLVDVLVDENRKLRELCKCALKNCYDAYEQVWGWDDDWVVLCDEARELGIEVPDGD